MTKTPVPDSRSIFLAFLLTTCVVAAQAQTLPSSPWSPDNGDGTYRNPIIHADYSDLDVIRVGDDFYMTASSFSHFPGLPILHSKDLVNWTLIGHAADEYPFPEFARPQHGMAIWAPALRYHDREFYIYFGDPDRGIFMTKATHPAGPWTPLRLIRKVTGWIDPCPFWDENGNAYLVHAWANSRAGIKSILAMNRMSADGMQILDDGVVVFDGHEIHPTIEGPKLHRRNGYYYIFAPAGGVKRGWQTVLRSRSIFGPYEDRIVLEQGSTRVNGPHQGAWVDTPSGEDWFIHFQDRHAYGRIVHLQPMRWENDWPVIGIDRDGNGIGEPVEMFRKPNVKNRLTIAAPAASDEFDAPVPGLQWQWESNGRPEWISLSAKPGSLRLFTQPMPAGSTNLWESGNLLLQKLPAPTFSATAKVRFEPTAPGQRVGVIVFGMDYSYIGIAATSSGLNVSNVVCRDAHKEKPEEGRASVDVPKGPIWFRIDVYPESDTAVVPVVFCRFNYSMDGESYVQLGPDFVAREGQWVGAKVGLFTVTSSADSAGGYADVDWFRITNK